MSTIGLSPVTVIVSSTAADPHARASTVRREVRRHLDAFAPDGVEPGQRERHGVGARRQVDDPVQAVPSVTAVRTFSMSAGLDTSTVTPGSTAPDGVLRRCRPRCPAPGPRRHTAGSGFPRLEAGLARFARKLSASLSSGVFRVHASFRYAEPLFPERTKIYASAPRLSRRARSNFGLFEKDYSSDNQRGRKRAGPAGPAPSLEPRNPTVPRTSRTAAG